MVKIKKSCVIIAIVAMFFVMFSNIYAKDLNIYEDGDIDSNFSGDSNIKVSFKIKVKQFDRAPNTDGYVQINKSYPPTSESYETYGLVFSKSPTTKYEKVDKIPANINDSLYDYGVYNGVRKGLYIINSLKDDGGDNVYKATGEATGVSTKEYAIGENGLKMYHFANGTYDTRLIGISQDMINQLKASGMFTLEKTVEGQKYKGVYVSVITTFRVNGTTCEARNGYTAMWNTMLTDMTWNGNTNGYDVNGGKDSSKCIFNLYDNILWIKEEKINPGKATVNTHFIENGNEVGSYSREISISGSTNVLEKPGKDVVEKLKDDNDYDKFIYTKYKIDNGSELTGDTLKASDLKDKSTIDVYFERTRVKIDYQYNGSIKYAKTGIYSGGSVSISRNDNNGAKLDNNYYYAADISPSSAGSISQSSDDVFANITNNNNNGNIIVVTFKYYHYKVTGNGNLRYHYIHSNGSEEIISSNMDFDLKKGESAKLNINKLVLHGDWFLNGTVYFGHLGGTISGAKVSVNSKEYGSSWSYGISNRSSFDLEITPNDVNSEIVIDIYYSLRVFDVQLVNASEQLIKGLRVIFTRSSFGSSFTADFLKDKDLSKPFKVSGIKEKFTFLGSKYTTRTNYSTANASIPSVRYTSNRSVTVDAMSAPSVLSNGGDYSIIRFKFNIIPNSKVYVRHLVKTSEKTDIKDGSGNYYLLLNELKNDTQRVRHDLDYYDINIGKGNISITDASEHFYELLNSTNTSSNYSECYEIEPSDTLHVERSNTIYMDNVRYKYEGAYVYKDSTSAFKVAMQNNTSYDIKGKTTYIDFIYNGVNGDCIDDCDPVPPDCVGPDCDNIEKTPDPVVPNIEITPKNEKGEDISGSSTSKNEDCNVVYVPVTEYLDSYLKTSMTYPYTLVYTPETVNKDTGAITYKIKKYDAYELQSAHIENSSSEEARYITNDRDGVISPNSGENYKFSITGISKAASTVSTLKSVNPQNDNSISSAIASIIEYTSESNFNNRTQQVKENKFNGVRTPQGVATYNINGIIGENEGKTIKTVASKSDTNTKVNVYTPLALEEPTIEMTSYVDHSVDNSDSVVIQKNAEFTLIPKLNESYKGDVYNDKINMKNYLQNYWVIFDFKVNQVVVYNADGSVYKGSDIKDSYDKNEEIYVPAGGKIKAREASGTSGLSVIGNLKVIASTKNASSNLISTVITNNPKLKADTSVSGLLTLIARKSIAKIATFCDEKSNTQEPTHVVKVDTDNDGKEDTKKNILYRDDESNQKEMKSDSKYFVQNSTTATNIDRIYDFEITDCLDVNFKNVFRKTSDGNVNDSTGIRYFSGIKRQIINQDGSAQGVNIIENRAVSVLNKVSTKTILPLGPVKHTDSTYLQAPKLGYRFSFDLKTAGAYAPVTVTEKKDKDGNVISKEKVANENETREVIITPSYYYISKDGNTFKNNVTLYYKNSSGKYVPFDTSNYSISFKPSDGYRSLDTMYAEDTTLLSEKLEKMVISKEFTLSSNMMTFHNVDVSYIQTWYGEFKLPNSTIVVEKGGNINNPLTNGYIGVKFDIKCKTTLKSSGKTVTISYNQNDRNKDKSIIPNTTQWDYEGYLGIQSGKELEGTLRIQLENGIWNINKDRYNDIRGTVILYDTDNRAAEDFD